MINEVELFTLNWVINETCQDVVKSLVDDFQSKMPLLDVANFCDPTYTRLELIKHLPDFDPNEGFDPNKGLAIPTTKPFRKIEPLLVLHQY
ncbi:hypothetical protein PCASD_03839 [Puccinia coronata f. sp. avenae]|uniref:Uncharacterized protein n=1 Tax=Puccinia coronata f. sp. avenae TaxID=200324 RepID=A0A2N5T2Y1_9BASI|nr:hypothetical protein PCASD_17215 [Puccinia coronata f. sp. avenae]PLW44265.1 hypothetical protein PCASD_03839 [Puccinia coronata f. sp. avenae]